MEGLINYLPKIVENNYIEIHNNLKLNNINNVFQFDGD